MAQLREPIALHDVDDVERLIRTSIRDARGPRPDTSDHDELLGDLIGLVWEASLRYTPGSGWKFSNLAYRVCRFGTINWIRRQPGNARPGRTPRPIFVELDPLGDALASSTGDPADDRSPDLMRALTPGSGERTRLFDEDRRPATRRAA